jgi:hypothetical protein
MSRLRPSSGNMKIRAYSEGNTIRYNTRIARNAKIDTVGHLIWDSILTVPIRTWRPTPPGISDEDNEGRGEKGLVK